MILLLRAARFDAANIVAANKLIARVSLAEVKSPYPYALMLPQSDTERLLDDHLNRLGVHIERQVELVGCCWRAGCRGDVALGVGK